jgi:hypothetical protein
LWSKNVLKACPFSPSFLVWLQKWKSIEKNATYLSLLKTVCRQCHKKCSIHTIYLPRANLCSTSRCATWGWTIKSYRTCSSGPILETAWTPSKMLRNLNYNFGKNHFSENSDLSFLHCMFNMNDFLIAFRHVRYNFLISFNINSAIDYTLIIEL